MLFQNTKIDERTRSNTRYAAALWRGGIAAYVTLTSFVVGGCLIIYGWPQPDEWANTWLPALLGPALIVGAYALVARLGRWRIERQIEKPGLGNS